MNYIIFSSFINNSVDIPPYILSGLSDGLYTIVYVTDVDTERTGFIVINSF